MKKIDIFCNRFDCWSNDKAKCKNQKIIGKNGKCIFYETKPNGESKTSGES